MITVYFAFKMLEKEEKREERKRELNKKKTERTYMFAEKV